MNNLSPEEQDILQSYENDEWISIADDKLLKNYHNAFSMSIIMFPPKSTVKRKRGGKGSKGKGVKSTIDPS